MSENIVFTKMIQRNGMRNDLPVLSPAEIGFTQDTSQMYIGADTDYNGYLSSNIIQIRPSVGAKELVESILSSTTGFSNLAVDGNLRIICSTDAEASEVLRLINDSVTAQYSNLIPIATISSNIEILTTHNYSTYLTPSYDNVTYNPIDTRNIAMHRLEAKLLDSTSGNVFVNVKRAEFQSIKVEYMLYQSDASDNRIHARKGVIDVLHDGRIIPAQNGIVDEILVTMGATSNIISFGVQTNPTFTAITINQPSNNKTRIFYTIKIWSIAGLLDLNADNTFTP